MRYDTDMISTANGIVGRDILEDWVPADNGIIRVALSWRIGFQPGCIDANGI